MVQRMVSVIVTTQNRQDLLHRAIMSVINQTYQNIEIIVIDDCSEDSTSEMMQNYMKQYETIRYFKNDVVCGANVSRNRGILEAKGQFIAGLDDDDEFMPNRIERLLESYDSAYAFITSYNMIIKPNGAISYFGKDNTIKFNDMLSMNRVGNQVLVERERLMNVGMYDEDLLACQDYDMWLRLMQHYGDAKIIPEYLQVIHEDDNVHRISTKSKNKKKGYWQFYKKYKDLMDESDRKYQLYNMFRINEKAMSQQTALALADEQNYEKVANWHIRTTQVGYKILVAFYEYLRSLPKDQEYILYGYGSVGKLMALYLNDKIIGIVDESLTEQSIDGYKVLSVKDLVHFPDQKVLVSPLIHKEEIIEKISCFHQNYEVLNLLN